MNKRFWDEVRAGRLQVNARNGKTQLPNCQQEKEEKANRNEENRNEENKEKEDVKMQTAARLAFCLKKTSELWSWFY